MLFLRGVTLHGPLYWQPKQCLFKRKFVVGIHPNCHRFASFDPAEHMSHEKEKSRTFRYTGCVIGILIMAYYNPHMNGFVQSPINPKQPGFLLHKW